MEIRKALVLSDYPRLREAVRKTLLLGQQRVDLEKVRTYWKTGKIISKHFSRYKNRGEHYSQDVVARLAEDLEIGERLLYRCIQFAQNIKNLSSWTNSFQNRLSWSHLRVLAAVPDEEKRWALADRAVKMKWTAEDLEREIKKLGYRFHGSGNGGPKKLPELLTPVKGAFYTYRLIRSEKIHAGKTDLRIDLGFSNYKEANMRGARHFKAGEIAVSEWVKGDTYRLVKPSAVVVAEPVQLFTYYAYIERVVDGDTLLVQVDLGFGVWTRQYLRLRDIDCPELDTSLGRRAKHFVEEELSSVPYVVISSSRSDKYDRYLADVFYETKSGEQFLNNRLLQARLAVRA